MGEARPSSIWLRRRVNDIAWFTIWQAIASTVLTLAVGLPAASVVARSSARRQRLVRALVTVPFVLPTVVVAGAFTEVFAVAGLDDGAFRLRHTVWAILIAHVFFNYAVVVRAVGSYWAGLDQRVEEAARVLGAGPWQTFREVTLPRLRPAVASAAAIVFLFSFTSFGVVLILGGPRRATVETEIYRQAVTRVDLETAAALAALQLLAVLALVILSTRLERRRPIVGRGARSSRRPAALAWRRGNLIIGLVLLGGPIGVLVERSFSTGGSYGLDHYEALGERRGSFGTGNDGVVELGRRRPCGYCDRCARRASGLARRGARSPRCRSDLRSRSHAAARHVGGDDRFRHAHRS